MVRKALLGAVLLLALAASPAAAQYSPTVVSPSTITPGGTVTVSGQACAPGETVIITLHSASGTQGIRQRVIATGDPITVATVTADDAGNYTATFIVPIDLPLGTYSVQSSCGTNVAGKTLTVVAPSTATTAPPVTTGTNGGTSSGGSSSGGSLVRTGSDLDRIGLVGAGLLVAGGMLLVATKRRRHATGMAA